MIAAARCSPISFYVHAPLARGPAFLDLADTAGTLAHSMIVSGVPGALGLEYKMCTLGAIASDGAQLAVQYRQLAQCCARVDGDYSTALEPV